MTPGVRRIRINSTAIHHDIHEQAVEIRCSSFFRTRAAEPPAAVILELDTATALTLLNQLIAAQVDVQEGE